MMITWNSQGFKWGCYMDLLIDFADQLCLQECGNMLPMAQKSWRPVGKEGVFREEEVNIGKSYYTPEYVQIFNWHNEMAGNPRCSLAILIKNYGYKINLQYYYPTMEDWEDEDIKVRYRPRPLIYYEYNENNIIATCHCPASNNAERVRNVYANYLNTKYPNHTWQMIGDFNCPPENTIYGTTLVWDSNSRTQDSGGILDYMVKRDDKVQVRAEVLGKPRGESDHWPVRFR